MTAYFDALTRHDLDAIAAAWAPDGVCHIAGQPDAHGPDGVRAWWAEFFGSSPDLRFDVEDIVGEGDQVAVHWSATGTFAGPGSLQGIEPTFARLDLAGLDIFRLRDGQIVSEHAYTDGMTLARQIGMLPPAGSSAEQRMTRAFNGQAKLKRRAVCNDPERIAEGVWLVRGGFPLKTMNVYLIEDEGGGVTMFDAGIKAMSTGLSRPPRPRSAGSTGSCSATPTPTTAAPRRRSACRPSATPPSGSTPRATAATHYFDWSRSLSVPGPLDAAAAAAGVGRRAGRDRRHGRRGRRRLGLPRRAHPGPRAGPDRAVPRVRPRRADHRLLLHARHRHRPPRPAARAGRAASTSTPSRRAPRSARSPRSSRRSPGPATPTRSPATCARSSSRPRRRPSRGQAQPPPRRRAARRPRGPLRRGGRHARPARRALARDADGVREGARRRARPGGRLAALRRVPLRAPRGALGDRRARSRSSARRTCSRASASPPARSGRGSATCCAPTWPRTSPTWRRREDRRPVRARPGPARASRCRPRSTTRTTSARRRCWRRSSAATSPTSPTARAGRRRPSR